MNKKILYIFTRTPLHVGAGSSVGAIDQPIQRERHTGFPIIPASSLKGTFADVWSDDLDTDEDEHGKKRVRVRRDGHRSDAAWLFGSDNPQFAAAGAVQFTEAGLFAFPIRSAKGSFAWITSPLILKRAARDGVLPRELLEKLSDSDPKDNEAIFDTGAGSKIAIEGQIVLEEYAFKAVTSWAGLSKLSNALAELIQDEVWAAIKDRLVVVSDGMMSFFARNACEVAQHVRISDETGTAEGSGLFNQENVPGETLFYSTIHFFKERTPGKNGSARNAEAAAEAFTKKINGDGGVFQFGGDASTGLGYCSVFMKGAENAKP